MRKTIKLISFSICLLFTNVQTAMEQSKKEEPPRLSVDKKAGYGTFKKCECCKTKESPQPEKKDNDSVPTKGLWERLKNLLKPKQQN